MRSIVAASIVVAVATGTGTQADPARWLDKARAIILKHHLLSASDLRCSSLVYGAESTSRTAGISVLENHGGPCPGDPETSPRRFTITIDTATGKAMWDGKDPGEMEPIR